MSSQTIFVVSPRHELRTRLCSLLEEHGYTVALIQSSVSATAILWEWPSPGVVLFSPIKPEGDIAPLLSVLTQDALLARHVYLAVMAEGHTLPRQVRDLLHGYDIPVFNLANDLDALLLEVAQVAGSTLPAEAASGARALSR
ncbi:MAG TPA: hypothetical protein VF807_08995 [Ktedonobacterales bacterium]